MEEMDRKINDEHKETKNVNGILKYSDEIISIASELLNRRDGDTEKDQEIDERLKNLSLKMKDDGIDLEADYRLKSENGEPNAQFFLALQYFVEKKYDEAKKWLIKSAENGYPEAMIHLGGHYLDDYFGIFGKDKEKALV